MIECVSQRERAEGTAFHQISAVTFFLGSGPEGVDDLFFHTYGEFSPPSSPPPPSPSPPLVSKLKSQPQAQITVSSLNPRLRFNSNLMA